MRQVRSQKPFHTGRMDIADPKKQVSQKLRILFKPQVSNVIF